MTDDFEKALIWNGLRDILVEEFWSNLLVAQQAQDTGHFPNPPNWCALVAAKFTKSAYPETWFTSLLVATRFRHLVNHQTTRDWWWFRRNFSLFASFEAGVGQVNLQRYSRNNENNQT